jgi:hypothetical protein
MGLRPGLKGDCDLEYGKVPKPMTCGGGCRIRPGECGCKGRRVLSGAVDVELPAGESWPGRGCWCWKAKRSGLPVMVRIGISS